MLDGGRVAGVATRAGIEFSARAVVLTVGTFLGGRLHIAISDRFEYELRLSPIDDGDHVFDCDGLALALNPASAVITSYSIHYTKLYEESFEEGHPLLLPSGHRTPGGGGRG